MFHLIYNWVKATTRFSMTTSAVEEACEKRLFEESKDTVDIE